MKSPPCPMHMLSADLAAAIFRLRVANGRVRVCVCVCVLEMVGIHVQVRSASRWVNEFSGVRDWVQYL